MLEDFMFDIQEHDVLHSSVELQLKRSDLGSFLKRNQKDDPTLCFIYVERKNLLHDKKDPLAIRNFKTGLRKQLSARQYIPEYFWSSVCQRLQGYFGSADEYSDDDKLTVHSTWFHFEVKYPFTEDERKEQKDKKEYEWFKMAFNTTWTAPGQQTVICYNVPELMRDELQMRLYSQDSKRLYDSYWIHLIIVESVIACYDKSVWNLRDLVRPLEQGRRGSQSSTPDEPSTPEKSKASEPNFTNLHEILRHALHASETLDVAVETVNSMIMQQRQFYQETGLISGKRKRDVSKTLSHLQTQQRMLKNILARAKANEARIRNEITLAFNTVAQQDTRIQLRNNDLQLRIARDSKADSYVMKMISIVTLVFLPMAIFSSIFSTSFFNFKPEGSSSVSSKFWVFLVISLPTTFCIALYGIWWMRKHSNRKDKHTEPGDEA